MSSAEPAPQERVSDRPVSRISSRKSSEPATELKSPARMQSSELPEQRTAWAMSTACTRRSGWLSQESSAITLCWAMRWVLKTSTSPCASSGTTDSDALRPTEALRDAAVLLLRQAGSISPTAWRFWPGAALSRHDSQSGQGRWETHSRGMGRICGMMDEGGWHRGGRRRGGRHHGGRHRASRASTRSADGMGDNCSPRESRHRKLTLSGSRATAKKCARQALWYSRRAGSLSSRFGQMTGHPWLRRRSPPRGPQSRTAPGRTGCQACRDLHAACRRCHRTCEPTRASRPTRWSRQHWVGNSSVALASAGLGLTWATFSPGFSPFFVLLREDRNPPHVLQAKASSGSRDT